MLHVLPAMPFSTGTLIVSAPGVSAPAADFFDLAVTGKGCHGSSPWQGVDAALVGAKILTGLETLSSREISPAHFSTLTIGQFRAGEADNALAGKALLSGTMRSMNEETREYMKKRLERIAKTTATAYRARAKVAWKSGCPCLQNDEQMSKIALECAKKALGDKYVLSAADLPKGGVGGSEDFAYIAQKVPSVMVGICAGSRGQGFDEPLHSPRVRFDEECMPFGAAYFAAVAFSSQFSVQKNTSKKHQKNTYH
jgi:hippurate hydrolase